MTTAHEGAAPQIVWGVKAISKEINREPRPTYYLLETGQLPGRKIGRRWCVTKDALGKFFADMTSGAK